ncbi:MAG: hypothetical protein RIT17_183 [Pseudomonadota bacterium]|jgi:hypothetical protein
MPSFEHGQNAMMAALDHGPAHLPHDLFAGTAERVLAGMAVHANTISHARLVALEDTFPRTLAHMGHADFNRLSRQFIERADVASQPLAAIGAGFAGFLTEQGDADGAADLARFEWRWLQSYHAADAEPLTLGALAGLDPDALLAVTLVAHPAASAAAYTPVVQTLLGAEVPELDGAEAILLTRPEAEVLVSPASTLMAEILALSRSPQPIGNLLAQGGEPHDDESQPVDAAMQALVTLINAGALVRA